MRFLWLVSKMQLQRVFTCKMLYTADFLSLYSRTTQGRLLQLPLHFGLKQRFPTRGHFPPWGSWALTRGPQAQHLLTVINWCKAGIFGLLTIKTKSRNRLDARNDIRLAQLKKSPASKSSIMRTRTNIAVTELIKLTVILNFLQFLWLFFVVFSIVVVFSFLLFFKNKKAVTSHTGLQQLRST